MGPVKEVGNLTPLALCLAYYIARQSLSTVSTQVSAVCMPQRDVAVSYRSAIMQAVMCTDTKRMAEQGWAC